MMYSTATEIACKCKQSNGAFDFLQAYTSWMPYCSMVLIFIFIFFFSSGPGMSLKILDMYEIF